MNLRCLSVPFLVGAALAAAPALRPEGPLVAQALGLYRAPATRMPATPADVLKLHQEGDATLAFGALTGRWIVDLLGEMKIPDDFMYQRMLAGFTWDEAGVRQLAAAGVPRLVLRALATGKPLALSGEARARLVQAGLDSQTAALLGATPATAALPPLKTMGELALAGNPMAQNPAFRAQMEGFQKKLEAQMAGQFRSEKFRMEIWGKVLENWRSRVQVGGDAQAVLGPMETEIVNPTPQPPDAGMSALFGTATLANNQFLKSTPLAAVLGAAEVLAVLKSRSTALLRAKSPREIETFHFEAPTPFHLRRKPSDLVLMRLQEDPAGPSAKVTKGTFFGRQFKPVDEPVGVEVTQDGEAWSVLPKAPLAPGAYAFLMGGEEVVFIPFLVK